MTWHTPRVPLDHQASTEPAQAPPTGYTQGPFRQVRQALADRPALADRIVCLTYLGIVAYLTAVYLTPSWASGTVSRR